MVVMLVTEWRLWRWRLHLSLMRLKLGNVVATVMRKMVMGVVMMLVNERLLCLCLLKSEDALAADIRCLDVLLLLLMMVMVMKIDLMVMGLRRRRRRWWWRDRVTV